MNLWGHRFSQNANQKISRFLSYPLISFQNRNLEIFGWHFGRNDDLINSFWIELTFSVLSFFERWKKTKTHFKILKSLKKDSWVYLAINDWYESSKWQRWREYLSSSKCLINSWCACNYRLLVAIFPKCIRSCLPRLISRWSWL